MATVEPSATFEPKPSDEEGDDWDDWGDWERSMTKRINELYHTQERFGSLADFSAPAITAPRRVWNKACCKLRTQLRAKMRIYSSI